MSRIEWTDFTVNPIRAERDGRRGHYCEKISPGCKNCYSSAMQRRFGMPPFQEQRQVRPDLFFDLAALERAAARRKPSRYFVCSMTDLFGGWVPLRWLDAVWSTMALAERHTWIVLTKRPNIMRDYVTDAVAAHQHVPANVHLYVSVENQATADERIPLLLQTPAAVRGVSYEPALGPVDFSRWLYVRWQCSGCRDHFNGEWQRICPGCGREGYWTGSHKFNSKRGRALDHVIVGGESGPGARPCDVDWIRSALRQCRDAEVPVFVKQLGARPYSTIWSPPALTVQQIDRFISEHGSEPDDITEDLRLRDRKGGDPSEWPKDLRVRQLPACEMGVTPERGGPAGVSSKPDGFGCGV